MQEYILQCGPIIAHLRDLVEAAKQFIEHVDQFGRGALGRQRGEVDDIRVQDATKT